MRDCLQYAGGPEVLKTEGWMEEFNGAKEIQRRDREREREEGASKIATNTTNFDESSVR